MKANLMLSLFSIFLTSLPGATLLESNDHSSCEEDLLHLGIDINSYKKGEQADLVLLAERNDYLLLYFFNPDLNVNYLTIDFEFTSSNNLEILKSNEKEHFDAKLTTLSKSNDGMFTKFKIDFDIPDENYRLYNLRQIIYGSGTSSYVIGDSYLYYTMSDGTKKYEMEQMDYLELKDTLMYEFFIEEDMFGGSDWDPLNGRNVFFYGFNQDRYDIDKLDEIEASYYEYDLNAIVSTGENSGSPLVVNRQNRYSMFSGGKNGRFNTLINNEKFISKKVIEPERKMVPGSSFLFFKKEEVNWNRIMKFSEIDDICSEELGSKLKSYFSGSEYIIEFADYSYDFVKSSISWIPSRAKELITDKEYYEDVLAYLKWFNSNMNWENSSDFNQYKIPFARAYNTKYIDRAQIIRMKFRDVFDNPYDVSVITTPISSSGVVDGSTDVEVSFDNGSFLFILLILVAAIMGIPLTLILIYLLKAIFGLIKAILKLPTKRAKKIGIEKKKGRR